MNQSLSHKNLPHNIQHCFTLVAESGQSRTRQNYKFKVKYVRTNIKSMCISIVGVKLWNILSLKLKTCCSINSFKKCMKENYINNYEKD